jgi:predicted RNA-binding Zn-ribbon protein involved in translation (DUF1610 family)
MSEEKEKEVKCPHCGAVLRDKNRRDVGVCFPCFAIGQSDFDEEDFDEEEN